MIEVSRTVYGRETYRGCLADREMRQKVTGVGHFASIFYSTTLEERTKAVEKQLDLDHQTTGILSPCNAFKLWVPRKQEDLGERQARFRCSSVAIIN
jgi:hypothetical protein